MKKSLFNEYEAYTPIGGELSDKIYKLLDPIVKEWANKGYSVKDIEAIVIDNISVISAIERATRAMKLRKEKIAVVVDDGSEGYGPFT